MFLLSKIYNKSLVIVMYMFSLTICTIIVSEPIIKHFDVLELSYEASISSEDIDDANKDKDTENNTEIQDLYLSSNYNLILCPILNSDILLSDQEVYFLSGYRDILSPPPKS